MRAPAGTHTPRRWLALILALAFVLRLGSAASLDTLALYSDTGGDAGWYLLNGSALVSGLRYVRGVPTDVSHLPTPPLYPLLVGSAQRLFPAPAQPAPCLKGTLLNLARCASTPNDAPSAAAVTALRLLQAVLSTAICACACGLAQRLTGQGRAGLLAAAILAVSPAFILESTRITSETVFMFLLAAGVWAFVEAIPRRAPALLLASAVLLGLAALTRAQVLLYPLGLAGLLVGLKLWGKTHMPGWARAPGWAVAFLLVYGLTVGTWTAYNLARWQHWVVGSEGFAAFLYIGAAGWESGQQVDQRLTGTNDQMPDQAAFATGAADAITSDTGGYLARRAREWLGAFTQPHGTEYFPGESIRTLVGDWWAQDRTAGGLLTIARTDGFGAKLVIYGFHYATLLLGLAGLWRMRRQPLALPMSGYLLYTALLHVALYALPRYFFPMFIFWTVFAAAALLARPTQGDTAPPTSRPVPKLRYTSND